MPVTRINNNQITDSSAGNVYLGVNAAAKVQDYSVTGGKLQNNLTYGSDFTITGNLTVQGNTTTIDTVNLVVEDPLILLAKEQTGAPTLDIGFIGKRGTENNIAFVWDESADEFVTVFTTSETTNTVITISSYASLKTLDMAVTGNLAVTGNTSFTGNITSLNVTGNITGGNLLTAGVLSATGNVTGGNVTTGGLVTATGNVTGGNVNTSGVVSVTGNVNSGNVNTAIVSATGNVIGANLETGGLVTATGNVTGGNVTTGGLVTATGNVTGGNLTTAGLVTATGNVTGGNILTGGYVSATGNVDSGNVNTGNVSATGNVAAAGFTGGNVSVTGNVYAINFVGNISGNIDAAGGNTQVQFNNGDLLDASANFTFDRATNVMSVTGTIEGTTVCATGTVTGSYVYSSGELSAAGNVVSANVFTAGQASATGNVTGGNLVTGGLATVTGNVIGGNLSTAGLVTATGNVTGGNINTSGVVSATGNVNSGNVNTAIVSATGNVIGANVSTAGLVTATGNVTGGNLVTSGLATVTGNVIGGNISTAGVVTATGNVTGGNVLTGGLVSATGNVTGNNFSAGGFVSAVGNVVTPTVVTTTVTTSSGDLILNSAGGALQWDGSGNIVMNSQWINNLSDPTQAQDAATKQYVDDSVSSGIHIHTPVDVETPTALPSATYNQGGTTATVTDTIAGNTVVFSTAVNPQVNDMLWFTNSFNGVVANIAYFVVSAPNTSAAVLSTTYNGTPVSNISNATGLTQAVRINSGFGANLVATASGALTVDSFSVSAGNRVLVYNQSNAYENGIYDVTDAGNVTAPWILTRSNDANTYIPDSSVGLDEGTYVYVKYGSTGAGESYVMTAPIGPFNIGQAAVTFTQFSASQVYSANTAAGLVLNGTIFSAKVDNDTTAFDGGGNISVKAGANLVTPNIGAATGTSLSLTGTATAGNLATSGTVSATGTATVGNLATAGTVSATATITGGNLATGGTVSATGTATVGNVATAGTVSATGNVTGGNVLTSGYVSATGNVDSGNVNTSIISATANVVGGNITTAGVVTATGNVTGGNLVTAGVVTATGNVTGGNITTSGNVDSGNVNTAIVSATGNVTGANVTTGGLITATGNITGGNLLTGGLISATGNITGANINAGIISATANVVGTGAVFSGNVSAANFIGNISGNIDAGGANTQVQFNDDDLLAGSSNFTFDKATNTMSVTGTIQGTTVSSTGNVVAGNVTTGGLITATGNITGGNILTAGLISATSTITSSANVTGANLITGGLVTATGNVTGGNVNTAGLVTAVGNVTGGNVTTGGLVTATGNVTGGNLNTAGLITATGNITGANLILTSGTIDGPAAGRITINGSDIDTDFAVDSDTVPNIFYVDAGTSTASFGNSTQTTGAIVSFQATDSILMPRGNTVQRPGTGVLGMLRFNTTGDSLEVYTSGGWEDVGVPAFTVITADSFTGNGSQTVFTLSNASTTAATIVSINGVVQIPTTAYAVSGTTLTFTEAPAVSDTIDARLLTTTTTVTAIENSSANAVVETLDTADTVQITGNLLPAANVTYDLGSNTMSWRNGYFSGSTIFLGNLQLKQVDANTFGVFTADGTTQANIDVGSIDVSSIVSGTTTIGISTPNGNAFMAPAGSNALVAASTGVFVTGLMSATGNITGNFILGNGSLLTGIDATSIQSGTSNVRVVSSGGNVTAGIGGTGNVLVLATTGAFVTGLASVTGNVIAGNVTTGGLISATGAVTGAAITGTSLTVSTGSVTCGSIVNANANGVGNIGSSTTYFNTVFAKATSAQYADLAEMYEADGLIEPGTVVAFGGSREVTTCAEDSSRRVAGVVSTNPSYIMNAGLEGKHAVAVALTGRVPTRVTGTIQKGDMLVSAGGGRARAEANPQVGAVIGKALADFDGAEGTIEVVVGRL